MRNDKKEEGPSYDGKHQGSVERTQVKLGVAQRHQQTRMGPIHLNPLMSLDRGVIAVRGLSLLCLGSYLPC